MTNSNVAELEISPVHLERRQPSSKTPTATAGVPNIRREITAEQICILTFDRPGSSANIFDRATLNELNEHLDFVAAHPELVGLVLGSAKKSIFIAGADLHSISAETDPARLRELAGVEGAYLPDYFTPTYDDRGRLHLVSSHRLAAEGV